MILHNLDINEYHSHTAISNSKLKAFRQKGPLFYKKKYIDKTIPEVKTEALSDGTAFETFLTEHGKFDSRYIVRPEGMDFRTVAGKSWKANYEGWEIITTEKLQTFQAMADALREHPLTGPMIADKNSIGQVSLRHMSSVFGLEMQTRPDWLNLKGCELSNGEPYINDLKTTDDFGDWFDWKDPNNMNAAIRTITKYDYHRQAALAQHVCIQDPEIGKVAQFLTVIEKQEPFRCGVFKMADSVLEIGFQSIERDLKRLKSCMDKNEWPNPTDKLITVAAPIWMQEAEIREYDAFQDEYSSGTDDQYQTEKEAAQEAGNAAADAIATINKGGRK